MEEQSMTERQGNELIELLARMLSEMKQIGNYVFELKMDIAAIKKDVYSIEQSKS